MRDTTSVAGRAWRRSAGAVVTGVGVVAVVVGVFWAGAYVYRALSVLDEPDRSWLFWGLAVLFLGVFLTALGGGLIAWGWRLMRSSRATEPDE